MRRRFAGWSSCTSSCPAPHATHSPSGSTAVIVPGGEAAGAACTAGAAWTRVCQTFTSVPRHPVVAPGQGTRPRTRLCRVTAGLCESCPQAQGVVFRGDGTLLSPQHGPSVEVLVHLHDGVACHRFAMDEG